MHTQYNKYAQQNYNNAHITTTNESHLDCETVLSCKMSL